MNNRTGRGDVSLAADTRQLENQLKELYADNNRLLGLIIEFNLAPDRYMHHSWLDVLAGYERASVLCSKNRLHKLSVPVLDYLDLQDNYCWDFGERGIRLVLLPAEVITGVIHFCGLAVHWQTIKRCVDGKEIQAVKEKFGDSGYEFALKNGSILAGTLDADDGAAGASSLVEKIVGSGRQIFANAVGEIPQAALVRFFLKYPREAYPELPAANSGKRDASLELCKRILSFQARSQWGFLFN